LGRKKGLKKLKGGGAMEQTKKSSIKKVIYLEGMGGSRYSLNHCEVIYYIDKDGTPKCESCSIMWGYPSCEGCPRDQVLQELLGEPSPQQA
jgi:hypothetical protein